MAVQLHDVDSKALLTTLTEEELATLVDLLEEEDEEDHNYFINTEVLDFLEGEGADAALVAKLRELVGSGEGIEVEWRRVD
jgi:inactivated superfamily I helicase